VAVDFRSALMCASDSTFQLRHTFDKDGATYKGTLDCAPRKHLRYLSVHWFTSSGVLLYNGNKVNAKVRTGGQTFTLSNTTYLSDAADPSLNRKLTVYKARRCFSSDLAIWCAQWALQRNV